MDFWISDWISGFHSGFLDFTVDFWISQWISGFQLGFLDFWISVWISADGVRDFFRDGPLGGFRAAMLPGQVTRAARAVSSWVEKNSVPPLINGRALDWSVVLTIGRLCPIVLQDNIVVSNKHN